MDISYIAGLFDGEGSISIIHQRAGVKKNPEKRWHILQVNITNSDLPVLKAVKKFLGFGGLRTKPVYGKNSNIKVVYCWYVRSIGAAKFLKMVYPHLYIKKKRAKIALDFQAKVSKHRYDFKMNRTWVYDACDKMRHLNHKFGSAKVLTYCKYRPHG